MSGPDVLDRSATAPPGRAARAGGVDPRFRERRIAVRKDAGRRRLKRLLLLVFVAVAALAAVLVLRSPVFDVDEVVVTGTSHLPADEIRAAAGIDQGTPLLLADLGAVAADSELGQRYARMLAEEEDRIAALQQAQAELPLQCLKAPADRRLGGAQLHGGGRQAAGIDDAQEGAQQIQAIGAGGEVIHACHV